MNGCIWVCTWFRQLCRCIGATSEEQWWQPESGTSGFVELINGNFHWEKHPYMGNGPLPCLITGTYIFGCSLIWSGRFFRWFYLVFSLIFMVIVVYWLNSVDEDVIKKQNKTKQNAHRKKKKTVHRQDAKRQRNRRILLTWRWDTLNLNIVFEIAVHTMNCRV